MNLKIEGASAFGFDSDSAGGEHTVFVDDVDKKTTKAANKQVVHVCRVPGDSVDLAGSQIASYRVVRGVSLAKNLIRWIWKVHELKVGELIICDY